MSKSQNFEHRDFCWHSKSQTKRANTSAPLDLCLSASEPAVIRLCGIPLGNKADITADLSVHAREANR